MKENVPPRIYCIPAAKAPVAAVFRRGPTDWSHVGLWDLEKRLYKAGAWLRGRIFPRRSDVSPDGRYLCYFAHKPNARWQHGEAYVALSKPPWLTALHAFPTCGTWTRGYYFTEDVEAEAGDYGELPIRYGLRSIPVVQFANERRRGWEETSDCPQKDPGDVWDQYRNARMQKRQPGGDTVLFVESLGWAGGEFGVEQAVDGIRVRYWLRQANGGVQLLNHLQWADWDGDGNLLVALREGSLQIWDVSARRVQVLFNEDMSMLRPNPVSTPEWAQRW